MVYLITYDLNKPHKDYSNVYAALGAFAHTRDSGLDSVWFISSQASASSLYYALRPHFDDDDRLFITQIRSGDHFGWLSKAVIDWLAAKV